MSKNARKILTPLKYIIIFSLLGSLPVSAVRYYQIYVTNATDYFLDLRLDHTVHRSYVPPGETVMLESGGTELLMEAFYSAGQGVDGYGTDTFKPVYAPPYHTRTDCAGRKTLYGKSNGCYSPVYETYEDHPEGNPDSDVWVVTEEVMRGGFGDEPTSYE